MRLRSEPSILISNWRCGYNLKLISQLLYILNYIILLKSTKLKSDLAACSIRWQLNIPFDFSTVLPALLDWSADLIISICK